MSRKNKIIVSVVGITIVLLALLGLTYAYYLTRIQGNTNTNSISITTADLRLVYRDGSPNILETEIEPSNEVYTKEFTVTNEGNVNIDYGVYLIDVINTFVRKDDIKYKMTCRTDGTLPCNQITSDTTFPSGITQMVTATIEPTKTHTYTFSFTYKDTGTDQSVDMGKELQAKIQIFAKDKNGEYLPYEEGTLAYNVINNIKNGSLEGKTTFTADVSSANMVENITTATDKILSTATDDYGTTYYFRGNPIDNYVNFAGMCWRIVRIQGDGTTKLVLASELPCSETNLTNDSGFATNGARGVKGTILTGHYGYRMQNGYAINDYINSPEENEKSARTQLNAWLNTKITSEEQAKLKNEEWCIGDLTNAYSYGDTGEIVGTVDEEIVSGTAFYYTAGNKYYVTKTPSYECETTGKDGEVDTNKVGMLTFDEIVYAGGGNSSNSNYYLNNNATTTYWWALSSSNFSGYGDFVFIVVNNGYLDSYIQADYDSFRPAVTLTSSVSITDGVGTIGDPYIIG